MNQLWVLSIFTASTVFCIEHDFKGFDDSILFGINWPGSKDLGENLIESSLENIQKPKNGEMMKVMTSQKESYECHLPEVIVHETVKIEDYDGPSPLELLMPLFTQKLCSYRMESYWGYEVCHGRFIRQYHEEREGKSFKMQEYFLGYWKYRNPEKIDELKSFIAASKENLGKPKLTKVEGIALPSIELLMDDGTLCDLNGKPRLTRVVYVCYIHGKHEVYSFKETSTCEYEIIILSPLLCEHPQFKPKESSENTITCTPIGDAPKKPRSLLAMEAETLRNQHQTIRLSSDDAKDIFAVLKVETIDKDGETHLKLELHPVNEGTTDNSNKLLPDRPLPAIVDDSPVRAFLNGENCLDGGSGWWKYEFCYGKHVSQYHVERTGERTSLLLGRFDEQAHIDWIKENKAKAPKPLDQRTSISHFYTNGDTCDKTGAPRQTEVKLKCVENSSTAQVSLYLLEPKTCHYILGVESPLICDILPLADENGLIKVSKPLEFNEKKSEEGHRAELGNELN